MLAVVVALDVDVFPTDELAVASADVGPASSPPQVAFSAPRLVYTRANAMDEHEFSGLRLDGPIHDPWPSGKRWRAVPEPYSLLGVAVTRRVQAREDRIVAIEARFPPLPAPEAIELRGRLLAGLSADPEWDIPNKPTRTTTTYRKAHSKLSVRLTIRGDAPLATLTVVLERTDDRHPDAAERERLFASAQTRAARGLLDDLFGPE